MAKILIYNQETQRMETYYKGEAEQMPYIQNNSLTVGEFRGVSASPTLWTTKECMVTWSEFRNYWGSPISARYVFKRIWEGGHSAMSQHYAGLAFDVGQNLSYITRNALRDAAYSFGEWSYVEPAYLTPTWVHFDKRYGTPACSSGYPTLYYGSVGVYVLVLQDALNALGFIVELDGYLGDNTYRGFQNFQEQYGLQIDGIVGCDTWRTLTNSAVGIGYTDTVKE